MRVTSLPIPGPLLLKLDSFEDERGSFTESFNIEKFCKLGINTTFVQDNYSISRYGTIRGIHLQLGEFSQSKIVQVLQGEVRDVIVDLRANSPTFGESLKIELSGRDNYQIFIPRGFGHGFSVLSEQAIFFYKCDNYYKKSAEAGVHYLDKSLNIDWGIEKQNQIVSQKDATLSSLKDFKESYGQ